jgi:hypothetical protein
VPSHAAGGLGGHLPGSGSQRAGLNFGRPRPKLGSDNAEAVSLQRTPSGRRLRGDRSTRRFTSHRPESGRGAPDALEAGSDVRIVEAVRRRRLRKRDPPTAVSKDTTRVAHDPAAMRTCDLHAMRRTRTNGSVRHGCGSL